MNKIFPSLLFAVSVLIAGTAAFFSVRGIGLLFVGSFLPVIVMASSLEIGKLFAVSFLYRKWYIMPKLLRLYLSIATLLLIIITSLGIFGFLSDAYQDTKNKVTFYDSKITNLEFKNQSLRKQIEDRQNLNSKQQDNINVNVDRYKQIYDDYVKQQNQTKQTILDKLSVMDQEVNMLKSKSSGLFSNSKKKLEELQAAQADDRTKYKDQIDKIDQGVQAQYNIFLDKVDKANNTQQEVSTSDNLLDQIEQNNEQILVLKESVHDTDIGSFRFIAQAFGIEVDTAVKWFIIMIVVVFDPLAMCLIIGYNVYVHGRASPQSQHVIPTKTMSTPAVKIKAVKK
jgi:hypothetical protein